MQMQALSWLNEDHWRNESNGPDADTRTSNGLSDFRKQVAGWKTQAGNIAHYEKQGYPVLMQEMMTPLCRELAGLHQDARSENRRVGKEQVITVEYGWSP